MKAFAALVSILLAFGAAPQSAPQASPRTLPPRLADRFSEGVTALKSGQLDEAEAAFRAVAAEAPDRAFVHHNLGIVLQQRGRPVEALVEFRTASRLDPAFGPARLLAGTCLLTLDRPKEAALELERAAKVLPDEPAVHLQLAEAYERSGNIPGVVDEYRRLAARTPSNAEYAYRLGRAYLRLAQWSYERMRVIAPKTPRLPQALAEQYLDQGQADQALVALTEAARLHPPLPEIHLAMAKIHFDAGRLDEAAAEVGRELAIAPESAAARELKAAIDAAKTPK